MKFQFLSQCDEVVFMDAGRVLDQGQHSELMSRNGYYASLIHTLFYAKRRKKQENKKCPILQKKSNYAILYI